MTSDAPTIVVGVDLSPGGEAALEEALRLSTAFGSRVFLIHVAAPEPDFVGFEVGPQHVRDWRADELRDEHRRLEQWQHRFQSAGLHCTALLVAGPTVGKLLEECERVGAGMIIVGTHGHGRMYDLLVGSTAQGIVRDSKVPVLLVPSAAPQAPDDD